MRVSRSELHQQDKLKRKKKVRKIMYINLTLLGIIFVLVGVWITVSNSDRVTDWFGGVGSKIVSENEQAETEAGEKEVAESEKDAEESKNAGQGDTNHSNGSESVDGESGETTSGNDPIQTDPPHEDESVAEESDPVAGETVSLSFVGDLLIGEYVDSFLKREGYDYIYRKSLLYLSEPDVMAGNLEYPITKRGIPAEKKEYVYKGSPEALPEFKNAGFDVVNLANNHTLDQGEEGLFDTMSHLDEAGISHMGAGKNDTEAFKALIKDVRGTKVAYIGLSKVVPDITWKAAKNKAGVAETYDTRRAVAAIAKAKEQADIVVVMVHWGTMYMDKPEQYQKDFARLYIDAGADLVIGSHPHVLQGFEMYKGKWIAYSLGNFIFSAFPKDTEGETGVLDAVCTKSGDCDLKFNPMYMVNAQPTPLEGDAAKAVLDRLTSISYQVKLKEDGTIVSK